MANTTAIQWTDLTWNIARGCSKVDKDCKNCYMFRQSLKGTRYKPDQVTKTKTVFTLPLKYKGTKSECWPGDPLVFTSSLTDFFHPDIDAYRHEAWDIIRRCPHLTFQILTKRTERIPDCLPEDWGDGWDNVWLGTSVGSHEGLKRINELQRIPAKIRFLSIEPLTEGLNLHPWLVLDLIHWLIVGGESGNENGKYKYRLCEISWIEAIVGQCKMFDVPVFVKQMGTYIAKQLNMKDRHGGDINEFPTELQIREFPNVK